MSRDRPSADGPGFGSGLDFSFPSLAPAQAPQGQQPAQNPFGLRTSSQPAAGPLQPPQQQVHLQQPVRPPSSSEPLTARSTVVHASSSRPAGPTTSQQQSAPRQQPAAPQKPVPLSQVQAEGRRNKVPLEKGFSQVSWLKLTKSNTDLTGGQGRRKDITIEEVRQHRTAEDAWMVLHGKVYNISPYLRYHPGGADILMKAAGKDGTSLFNKYHPWVNAHALLEKCLVGLLHKPGDGEQTQAQQQQAEQQPAGQSLKSKLVQLFK